MMLFFISNLVVIIKLDHGLDSQLRRDDAAICFNKQRFFPLFLLRAACVSFLFLAPTSGFLLNR